MERSASFRTQLLNGLCARAQAVRRDRARGISRTSALETRRAPQHRPRFWKRAASMWESFTHLLNVLQEAGLIRVSNSYPFEEIQLTPEAEEALRDPS